MAQKRQRARRQPAKPALRPGFEGRRQVVDETVTVIDEDGRQRRASVKRNVRHDPIMQLANQRTAKGRPVLSTEQVAAATRVRELVELLGLSGVRAAKLDGDVVDGGSGPVAIRDAQLAAGRELARLEGALGVVAMNVVVRVAGYGEALTMVAIDFEDDEDQLKGGACGQFTRKTVGWTLRQGLTQAAVHFGYAAPGTGARRRRLMSWRDSNGRPRVLPESWNPAPGQPGG